MKTCCVAGATRASQGGSAHMRLVALRFCDYFEPASVSGASLSACPSQQFNPTLRQRKTWGAKDARRNRRTRRPWRNWPTSFGCSVAVPKVRPKKTGIRPSACCNPARLLEQRSRARKANLATKPRARGISRRRAPAAHQGGPPHPQSLGRRSPGGISSSRSGLSPARKRAKQQGNRTRLVVPLLGVGHSAALPLAGALCFISRPVVCGPPATGHPA